MASGEMEVLVHRRTLFDDARGVGEALNETECGCLRYTHVVCVPIWHRGGGPQSAHSCDCVGVTARGTHTLSVAAPTSPLVRRRAQRLLHNPPVLAMGVMDAARTPSSSLLPWNAPWLPGTLHPSLHIPTLERVNASAVLLRIAHQWAAAEGVTSGEASGEASGVALDLRDVLPVGREVLAVVETTLTGVEIRNATQRLRFDGGGPTNSGTLCAAQRRC